MRPPLRDMCPYFGYMVPDQENMCRSNGFMRPTQKNMRPATRKRKRAHQPSS